MACGELSYSKVRALTRVATPATVDTLLMIALHGAAHHVETVSRYFRHVQEAAALSLEARRQAGRTVDYWYDHDGSLVLKARLPALAGALLIKALEAAMQAVPATDVHVQLAEEQPLSYQARRADALARIAETYLQHETGELCAADRHQVVLHVDAETLREHGPGRCHIEHGPALPVATLRRLTCDASLVRIRESEDGEPLDVGRETRTIPPAIRRALHEGDIRVAARADGGWHFRRPDGRDFEVVRREPAPSYHWSALGEANAAPGHRHRLGDRGDPVAGERLDYHLAIPILCAQAGIPAPVCGPCGTGHAETTGHADTTDLPPAAGDVSAVTSSAPRSTDEDDIGHWCDGTTWREYRMGE